VKDGRSLASLVAAVELELARDTAEGELAAEAAAEVAAELVWETMAAGPAAEAGPAVDADAAAELLAEASAVHANAAARARLGANVTSTGCAFAVWAPHAGAMTAVLLCDGSAAVGGSDSGGAAEPMRVPMVSNHEENYAYFRCEVPGIGSGTRYYFEVTMPGGRAKQILLATS
jgi:hypothetical protein